jgi:hypothetical protein
MVILVVGVVDVDGSIIVHHSSATANEKHASKT